MFVHKYGASLWTLEKWEKYLVCYKMIIFNVTVLKSSDNVCILLTYKVLSLPKIKNIAPLQKKDKKSNIITILSIIC